MHCIAITNKQTSRNAPVFVWLLMNWLLFDYWCLVFGYSCIYALIIFCSEAGLSEGPVWQFSIFSTTSYPSTTSPKIVWRIVSHGVAAVVIKNWLPLVFGPAFAIASRPLRSNTTSFETSSSNGLPQIDSPPMPVPVGSPP